jgi:protein-S-isoprenylcysteine O-methyltransferase Ste14
MDLKSNWSPSLQVFEGHTLVANGIYAYIRHPMVASGWVLAVSQSLLLQNWLAGPSYLIVFFPFISCACGRKKK